MRGSAPFFAHADEEVLRVRGKGRKGWWPALRDAALLRVAYAYGLRRNETRMLDLTDFGRNSEGREFGEYGTLLVRYGKAKKGSPPKRRSVLTVWHWTPGTIEEWISEVRPGMRHATGRVLWPSERGPRVGLQRLDSRFAAYRDAIGLALALEFHSLRRSYITHLIEDGHDPLFVQQQDGHDHASTTALYTCVCSAFRPHSCVASWTPPSRPLCGRGGPPDATSGQLPVAPARADGRPRHVHRRRADAAPDRTRHHTVLLPRPTVWSPALRNGCPCRCWPPCATSSTARPPT
ncbi:tyrosine-type recombinase/integrase [Streptomyces sp. NPDC017529]|uniref:tyrosine-type recombinase/integrase n=1 Tax=Streptomyces sp. NPDC017529 TaxID=3365000 RepID=UPI0037A671AC